MTLPHAKLQSMVTGNSVELPAKWMHVSPEAQYPETDFLGRDSSSC